METSDQISVDDFYNGQNIFVTGATGFLGIALVEKILSCLPDSGTIYLLIRPKRGKDVNSRLEELKKNLIFEKVIESRGEGIFKRLVGIAGDVGEDNLGLSPADRQLLVNNINIVFHSAATLDFEADLKQTVKINLLGTRRVVQLCSEINNLKALVHVSSAYVNSDKDKNIEEKVYPQEEDCEKIINLSTTLFDAAVDELTPKLLGKHPNTYTLTKAFAEQEVLNANFPRAIVRPSMIVGAWKEPVPGWTISKNGPQGFLMGASKGVIRRLPVALNLVYDYIPVDVVVNELIVAAWRSGSQRLHDVQIYHCTSSTVRPFSWQQVSSRVNQNLHKYPLKSAVWYPTLKFLPSLFLFRLSAIFVHFLPALLLDLVTVAAGAKPKLIKLHRNVFNSLSRLEPFIFRQWFFENDNTKKLDALLSNNDREKFYLDISTLQWDDFFINLALGVRLYLCDEKITTLPAARKKNTILFFLNLLVQGVWCVFLWYLISCFLGLSMKSTVWAFPLTYVLFSIL